MRCSQVDDLVHKKRPNPAKIQAGMKNEYGLISPHAASCFFAFLRDFPAIYGVIDKRWPFKVFCGRRGATRDHEPRRGEGSALPIRRRRAATRLETSSFARCATEDESSRRWRRVHAAHAGSFAAPGHERRLRGTRKYTKSPSSPSPRKACSRGDGTRRLW